ncbi:hypothetical protein [Sandaracinus amylolyticus]|uniref:hypothetical protein n=1 Tax=Sandaracinus amylolyticus TaxID=927083 RepID=UPI001F4328B5|nr:hypothetical protein [Sandaracinus amylolyticus]UJR84315.1 Hypothetical protein I5071_63930 [Sandaracinus amylolyticus]
MSAYLERAALHQTRFRTPGVAPDTRGVVLGQKGALLFPSLDRVVAFFRAYGDDGSIDEILPSLSIRRVITPLRTRELLVMLAAESSYRMDRVAAIARLAGGMVFTGTSRHFVKYRDAASPLGYDVAELFDQPADAIVYSDSFRQVYTFEREIPFRELVLKLEPHRAPPGEGKSAPTRLWCTAEVGVGHALIGYLFRWRVRARVALAEWPSQSAFDDAPVRMHVLELEETPHRVIALLRTLPGVHVFEPLGATFGVELGFKHPIALESCQSLFANAGLTLFRGDGKVTVVDPTPPFVPVRSLVRSTLTMESAQNVASGAAIDQGMRPMALDLRLAPTNAPWRNVVATVVPASQREWLAKLLYVLPQRTLESLRIAVTERAYYLLDPAGIEGVPLGRFYGEVATRIYVPAGMTLVPAIAASVLEELVRDRGGGHVFFEPDSPTPRVIANEAFGAVSRRVLRELSGQVVHAEAPDRVDPPLPTLQYGPETRFPLWGAPGRAETEAGEKKSE